MAAAVATYSGRSIIWNRMKGNGTEGKNIGWGTGVPGLDAANWDVNLFAPRTESRVACTSTLQTSGQLADTYQNVGTLTALTIGGITEIMLFDTAAALSPTTTLTASGTAATTGSQLVASSAGFPGSGTGNYYAQINNEVVVATTVDGTHINLITRGVLGSTASGYAAAAIITLGGDGGAGTGGATSAQTATVGSAQGGNGFIHANFAVMNLNINDSIQFTVRDQLT